MRAVLLAVALAVAASVPPRVAIKITPRAVMAGSAVRVTCTVPRDSRNRSLEVGISNYMRSSRQLDGEDARITWEFTFEHVPCAADMAVCLLHSQGMGDAYADAPLLMVGCDDAH